MIIVTGGAGFIGTNFVSQWLDNSQLGGLVSVDKLMYAGSTANSALFNANPLYNFEQADICNNALVQELFRKYQPTTIVHFAAESHVDRSISGPEVFIKTNIGGTFNLLQNAFRYYQGLASDDREQFRFMHVSTDEVYGSLSSNEPAFSENHTYLPNNPYSASKAASDHLVRAWCKTYGLPAITTRCSNNYGPHQFPEKFIPLIILNALAGKSLPVYGDGQNIRDWLYVSDHCQAIRAVMANGRIGETYNIGGNCELKNIDVVNRICQILDQKYPKNQGSYVDQIRFVADRPGHDRRYAIDARKIRSELSWQPSYSFEAGIDNTINWYLDNPQWVRIAQSVNNGTGTVQNKQ